MARANLLHRAIRAAPPDGPTLYFTTAGFFGVDAPGGDRVGDLVFYRPRRRAVERALGRVAADLPTDAHILAGVDLDDDEYQHQELWLWGSSGAEAGPIHRRQKPVAARRLSVEGFVVLPFICGEMNDGTAGFVPKTDLARIDVVLNAAHVSVNRASDPMNRWQYAPFHRSFLDIAPHTGAMLAHGHDDAERLRCRRNWVVYRGAAPFPNDGEASPSGPLTILRVP